MKTVSPAADGGLDADAVWNRVPAPGDEARLYRNWNLPVKNHKLTNKERCGIMYRKKFPSFQPAQPLPHEVSGKAGMGIP